MKYLEKSRMMYRIMLAITILSGFWFAISFLASIAALIIPSGIAFVILLLLTLNLRMLIHDGQRELKTIHERLEALENAGSDTHARHPKFD
ncbi:MAG: hypothetical protein LBM60_06490 [Clostridium sp.]|jgi:hypothetical protein|nr:hypothetical protein [Clostridium sp.]